MNMEMIRRDLRNLLKASRFRHSEGVANVTYDLALIHGYDTQKAELTGILHDCAKYLSDQELMEACQKYNLPVTEVESRCPFLLHAKVGAYFARTRYDITDEEILSAITYHTTGRPDMTLLEKIIYTADYIEPYRKPLPRIMEIREAAYLNLDQAVYMIAENILNYLRSTGKEFDHLTVETYNYYKAILKTNFFNE